MTKELDSRPSDALNLAVLTGSPIYMAEEVFAMVNQDEAAAYIEKARST